MSETEAPVRTKFHPTYWLLAASMIAIGAMFLVSPDRNVAIPLLLVAVTASYVVRWRLPAEGVIPWLIRGVAFALIIFTGPEAKATRVWYMDPATMCLIGTMLEAELAVEGFLFRGGKTRIGQMLSLTSGIALAGTVGDRASFMVVLAPIYVVCLLGVLREFRPALTSSPALSSPPPSRTSRRWLLQGTALVMALTLGFASAGFVRWLYFDMSRFGMRWMQALLPSPTQGGMNGNERLGGTYNQIQSTSRNLKISGTAGVMYLRGLAFDKYHEGIWEPMFDRRQWDPIPAPQLPQSGAKTFEVERLSDSLDLVYLPIDSPGFGTPLTSQNQAGRGMLPAYKSVTESGENLVYQVAMPRTGVQGPLCAAPTAEDREKYLQVPDTLEPGVKAIAESVKGPNAVATIDKVVKYLEANHQYTLTSDFRTPRDVISYFLIEKKNAHCQFFASAATLLLRLDGVPCRYVTGYLAHEMAGKDSMVVRGRDAHAWVEAYLDGAGWVTVEATPGNGRPTEQSAAVGWYQWAKDAISDAMAAVAKFFRKLTFVHIAIGGGALLAVALLFQAIKNWRAKRRLPRIRAYCFPDEEYRAMAVEFEQMLKRMGEGPAGAATWNEHLDILSAQTRRTGRHAKLDRARAFVAAYNRTRFGRPGDRPAMRELRTLLDELKEL